MTDALDSLTDKEKETLRLILRGHDAKSTARALDLSVHTINDRLRVARRKLSVTSSREAARLLDRRERATPQNSAGNDLGEARNPATGHGAGPGDTSRTKNRFARGATGAAVMSISLAVLAFVSFGGGSAPVAEFFQSNAQSAPRSAETPAASEASRAARAWLELGDQGRWAEGHAATASSFREVNTAAVWAEVSEQVRTPLGALVSRVLVSQESVPGQRTGVEVVRFRSDFANRQGVTETVSLVREGGAWRVVGVYLD